MSGAKFTAKRGPKAKPASKPGIRSLAQRHGSATKKGPGRLHKEGHEKNVIKRVKEPGGYGKGLVASWTRQQRNAIEAKKGKGAVIVAALRKEAIELRETFGEPA